MNDMLLVHNTLKFFFAALLLYIDSVFPFLYNYLANEKTCGYGGIGRRARFRF